MVLGAREREREKIEEEGKLMVASVVVATR